MTGRVVHVRGGDSTALASRWAVLHQVGPTGGAPVDSQQTDRAGRYALHAPAVDTTASYLVSVYHHGIAYFTKPLRPAGAVGTADTLFVYDTASASPPIDLGERHVMVRSRDSDGSRRVIELLVLVNRGDKTRVAVDTLRPVWRGAVPTEAVQFEVGASEVSDQAIARRGGAVEVFAPVPPGERQLLIGYVLPRSVSELALPIDQDTERLSVMLEDTAAVLQGALAFEGWETLEGLAFRRFAAAQVPAGTPVLIRFRAGPLAPTAVLWIVVPLATLALVAGLVRWWRQAGIESPVQESPAVLAGRIAALDAAFAGREDDDYRRQRAELKRRLVEELARREST
ncbi:MAG: hypothetical protein GTN62_01330 [Gemmatimonadales bacterium]|nr:hypothetical protein [Gemmatimonadales bacterium]NIN48747.1 hypothetical protein [Gemmatimonadales bacterium]NIP06211.1 hypothetical protein [Gemmatimonadales bacterium]NIR01396.1 hypothetical protein [Gemmatimonadales bacterium]NIS65298.1 hypothetical protein [Gemmatimonadales bacterium]